MKKIVIIGAGGHGKVVADVAESAGYSEIVFLDDNSEILECGAYRVIGTSDKAEELAAQGYDVFVAVGNAEIRKRLITELVKMNVECPVLIHKSATVSKNVKIGQGTVIMPGVVINSGTVIGKGCIINTSSSLDHDNCLNDFVHVSVCIRAHGWTRNLPKDSSIYKKNDNDFYESFNFIMPGYNLRPLELEGAIGKEQLNKMDDIIAQRRENAAYFESKMSEISEHYDIQKECGKSSWFGFAVILKGKLLGQRDKLVKILRENGVEVRPIVAGNFTKSSAIRYMDYEIQGDLHNANVIHDNGFFVGNHCKNNFEKIDMFVDLLKEFAK